MEEPYFNAPSNTQRWPEIAFKSAKLFLGVSGHVSRRFYSVAGLVLMGFKYIVESALIFALTGMWFDPVAFVIPSLLIRSGYYSAAPPWLPWAIAAWSIGFVWIAVTLSIRRAVDAGHTPWMGIWVLCPLVNLFVMLYLALAPTNHDRCDEVDRHDRNFNGVLDQEKLAPIYCAFLGVLVGGLFALAITIASVYTMDSYGSALFLGMPLVSGSVAGYVFNQPAMRGLWPSIIVGAISVVFGGIGLLLFAFEGVICLVMAAPLIIPVGGLGGFLGWALSKTILLQSKWMLGGAFLVVPFFTLVESHTRTYKVEMVETSVIINAAPDEVWDKVIEFPEITEPPAWYFRLGVSTPMRARIEGQGRGAVRYCEFTTGSFVEPITTWDQPRHLAFNVTDQPDPLVEMTPYASVHPPHLQHSFRSVRGEFKLVDQKDGRTRLIGRTWYTIDMGPRFYWQFWTDEIIHRIHLRVLDHIRMNAENTSR